MADPTLRIGSSTVAMAAAGDVDALADIVRAHHQEMVRVAYVVSRDADLAQDAVQLAWQVAWRKLGALRDSDRLRPWLMAIAANEARQLLRRQRRRMVTTIEVADVASSRADPAQDPALIDLQQTLVRLAPDDRALLGLRYLAGMDATEIGQALGLSSSGVRSRLSRLMAQLREDLSDA